MARTWKEIWACATKLRDEAREEGGFNEDRARDAIAGGYYACYHRAQEWLMAATRWDDYYAERQGSHEYCWKLFGQRKGDDKRHMAVYDKGLVAKKRRKFASYKIGMDFSQDEFERAWLDIEGLYSALSQLPKP